MLLLITSSDRLRVFKPIMPVNVRSFVEGTVQ